MLEVVHHETGMGEREDYGRKVAFGVITDDGWTDEPLCEMPTHRGNPTNLPGIDRLVDFKG